MAIKRFKRDNFGNGIHSEFFIDSADDLEVIEDIYDCELGDKAFTPSGAEYVRHSDEFEGDLWILVSDQHGSDSSGGGGGVMQCVILRDPDTGDYIADKSFADVFSVIYDGETVQIYIDGSPTIQPHAGGSGTAQDPYIIDFYGFSITTNGSQPTQIYVSRYNWIEADGVQWKGDGVATLSPAE